MTIYYSHINPVKLYYQNPSTAYSTRHIDNFQFFDTIAPWNEKQDYYQPWKLSMPIRLQLESNATNHDVFLVDEYGVDQASGGFAQGPANVDDPTFHIYELDMDVSGVPTGLYQLKVIITDGTDTLTLISNHLVICSNHEHSILLEYTHPEYHEGMNFGTGFAPMLLVEGAIIYKSPASKDSDFEDQPLDLTLLSSVPFDLYELIIGDARGVPDYMIKMINRILSCKYKKIDNRYYEKSTGAKWEPNEQDGYPARGWRLEMREAENIPFIEFVPGGESLLKIALEDAEGSILMENSGYILQE